MIEPAPAIPEWIFVLRAGLNRHRAALFVAVVAAVAAVVILVIP